MIKANCKACFYSEQDTDANKFFCVNANSTKHNKYVEWNYKCEVYKENVPAFLRQRGIIK